MLSVNEKKIANTVASVTLEPKVVVTAQLKSVNRMFGNGLWLDISVTGNAR